jgi:hypothetical protein
VTATLDVVGEPVVTSSCSISLVKASEPAETATGPARSEVAPRGWPDDDLGEGPVDPPSAKTGDVALWGDGTLTSSAGRQGACSWHDGLDDADTGGVGAGYTYVKPYFRSDGTLVSGHYRSLPRP